MVPPTSLAMLLTLMCVVGLSPNLQAQDAPPESMLGFTVGVARNYVLGPPDALMEGESARWTITLHHCEGEGADRVAVFDLDYERRESRPPVLESRVTRSVWAELTVNDAGFPLRVVVGERIEAGEIITEYQYQGDGRYRRTTRWPETELTIDLRLPGQDDDDGLTGTFLFLTQIADQRFSGGAPFMDNIFANPGLLSLAIPLPLPLDDWSRELYFMSPGTRLVRYPTQEWIREQRNAWVLRQHFDRNRLKLGDVEEIDRGGTPGLARRFEIEGPFRSGYVDSLGRVLLLQWDAGAGMERPRHIRLLAPGEQ